MYRYDEFDDAFVRRRVQRFREQIERRVSGVLSEEEFKPLRLQNGLYLQLHAYMLRVAVPYGSLNGEQMRQLAMIAERWDRGYGHFTTRQNIQFNWPTLDAVPDILDALADVGMHAMQTSGNCIRNITADHFAGAAADEIEDPRPLAELLRQWSTDHPEFAYLPRKFKIAVSGATTDRAVTLAHDIGIRLVRDDAGRVACRVIVGGGLGRTPVVGQVLRDDLPKEDLLDYVESVLRVYNLAGRRDNKYKARIKILVKAMGIDAFRSAVDEQLALLRTRPRPTTPPLAGEALAGIERYFAPPAFATFDAPVELSIRPSSEPDPRPLDPEYARWCKHNHHPHKQPGYTIVTVSLKAPGEVPGDATAEQMRVVADLAERYAHDEIRVSHEQNLVLPHVPDRHLPEIHRRLAEHGLASANVGLISDIIACPGMDYCALATARSIPVAQDVARHFADPAYAESIGAIKIKISGCINACGHHHVANIGILGLEKGGKENYQFTFGGDHGERLTLGERAGPGIDAEEVVPALERVMQTYISERTDASEPFLSTYGRLGLEPFRRALYRSDTR